MIGFPFFKSSVDGWYEGKKHDLICAIDEQFLEYKNQNSFQTDRHRKRDYHQVFDKLLQENLFLLVVSYIFLNFARYLSQKLYLGMSSN